MVNRQPSTLIAAQAKTDVQKAAPSIDEDLPGVYNSPRRALAWVMMCFITSLIHYGYLWGRGDLKKLDGVGKATIMLGSFCAGVAFWPPVLLYWFPKPSIEQCLAGAFVGTLCSYALIHAIISKWSAKIIESLTPTFLKSTKDGTK
jgi:hypothetical protein